MTLVYPQLRKCLENAVSPALKLFKTRVCFLGYKSSISLENLYPKSNLSITTTIKPVSDGGQKFSGYIPMDKIEMTFSRSAGPGGQNVNKVNTKVDIRFHLKSANWLSEGIKKGLENNLSSKITKEGYLVFRSDVTRSQQLNIADCLEKLRCAIRLAAEPVVCQPTPETAERLRRRHEKAVQERLMIKRERAKIKQDRRSADGLDIL